MSKYLQIWLPVALLGIGCSIAYGQALSGDYDVALQQSGQGLPPVVVDPATLPKPGPDATGGQGGFDPQQYSGVNSGAGAINPDGTIPWSSNLITRDSDRVGSYNQPVWTTQRPFAASRTYVLPAGQMQVEQWARPTFPKGKKPEYRFLTEYAVGLTGRFQLDIYERWNVEPNANDEEQANHEGVQIELRYALANWGEIWMNPTLYGEWVEKGGPQDKPNKYELKLLLADEIAPNLFYASNFILEQEVRGEKENELGWSNALSTPLIERKLMAGVECLWAGTQNNAPNAKRSNEFTIGPSLQWRPTNRLYLTLVSLFGTTHDAPDCQIYAIMGYQFGGRAGPSGNIAGPASTIGN